MSVEENGRADSVPTSIRRLDNVNARRLARLVEVYDDLQTVLRCCERLMVMTGDARNEPDELGVEAIWTLALLSYARAFADQDGVVVLTDGDLHDDKKDDQSDGKDDGEVKRWHRVMLHLRDHHADPGANPRETYTVGVAQDQAGPPNAVAVTSVRSPLVDQAAVRQLGALAFPLCAVLDERMDPLQRTILQDIRATPKSELEALERIDVAAG